MLGFLLLNYIMFETNIPPDLLHSSLVTCNIWGWSGAQSLLTDGLTETKLIGNILTSSEIMSPAPSNQESGSASAGQPQTSEHIIMKIYIVEILKKDLKSSIWFSLCEDRSFLICFVVYFALCNIRESIFDKIFLNQNILMVNSNASCRIGSKVMRNSMRGIIKWYWEGKASRKVWRASE